jgi:hypothetical protein
MGKITAYPGNIWHIPQYKKFDLGTHKNIWIYMMIVMVFGLVWLINFINAKTTLITMISATTYYFNSNEDKDGEAEVSTAVSYAYKYHLGTLAFGSLIIAIVEVIRFLFEFVAEQLVKASGDNCCVKCIVGCASCLLACLERCVDYINRAAYSFIAISGQSFISGAQDGMLLNLKHGLEFAWAMTLAKGFIWLGKIALITLNMFTGYLLMKNVTSEINDHQSATVPLIFIGLMQFVICEIFLGLFDEAV